MLVSLLGPYLRLKRIQIQRKEDEKKKLGRNKKSYTSNIREQGTCSNVHKKAVADVSFTKNLDVY